MTDLGQRAAVTTRKEKTMGRRLAVLTAIALCIGWSGPALSNTLKAMKVDRQDIVEFVDDLYPGIVRIIELQERGYVYLRP